MILFKVFSGDGPGSSFEPNLSWFNPLNIEAGNLNPFSAESGGLIQAMLLGIFIYWGWESAVNLNEETEGDVTRPGLAGLISTLILLVTYVGVATAVLAWHGIGGAAAFDDKPGILGKYAESALGEPLGLARAARRRRLGARLDADDDPARLADGALDGTARGHPERLRRGLEAVLHARLLDGRDRRPRDRLVRAGQADQQVVPVRLADGPRA